MISLSRIIKSTRYAHSKEAIILSVKAPPLPKTVQASEKLQLIHPEVENAKIEAEAILLDAEKTANRMLEDAAAQAEQLKQQALAEIAAWWEQKRQEAEQLFQETEAEARQAGFAQGVEEGKAFVIQEEQQTIQTARDVLESAYRAKEQIIAEAEPFVVELSMEVAKKVIGQELSEAPEKILELARRVLRRSRVQGPITLCVNHRYFDFLMEHRQQLLALLDGQAELSIFPDYTVQDEGCVIRTPLGSVDARIDTQLQEIKQVLMEIAQGSETDERS
ncbi:flagellar assembly protein FliH [Brevibacillus sp. SYP-B805]|uniref:FliH/SctL family protein n=1 Tax=Brevibacillus sp. SYP-B805 TaxID=1578199 RepID=UPI0013EBE132|nr:FliH/SctL family protein [Brevibacillus sp. SYP-B805]NGQ94007.1 flagellar assembly protein FliH [Brevibacillus sp. SYP-B805]